MVRSQTLYPAELRARRSANAVKIDYDTEPRSSTRRIAITAVMTAQERQTLLPQFSENRAIQFQLELWIAAEYAQLSRKSHCPDFAAALR